MRLYSDTDAALPPLAWAANSHFPAFLHYERRKTGRCSFTAALIGGKVHVPVFLRSERRKTGNCSFTAPLIGGKVHFPVFLRSERRKTGNCIYAAGTYGGSLSVRFLILFLLPSFASWWVMGWGLVPQNEGRTCLNNNWVKQYQITVKAR